MAVAIAPNRVAAALQQTLVELIDLSLQAKHFHWSVIGPRFRSVHLELDEITDAVRLAYDEAAERLAALDVPPDGRLATIAGSTSLAAPGDGWQDDDSVLGAMCDRLTHVASQIQARAVEIGETDLVSQDLLVGIAGMLQKHAWMLRVQAR